MKNENFVSTNDLVWYLPRVTGGKVAARIIGDIDYDGQTCTIEITATGSNTYPHGYKIYDVSPNSIASRRNWDEVTIAPKWLIHWFRELPTITRIYHYGNDYRRDTLNAHEFYLEVKREIDSTNAGLCWFYAGTNENGRQLETQRPEAVLGALKEYGRIERGWTTWAIAE